jgi:hypothetical protein
MMICIEKTNKTTEKKRAEITLFVLQCYPTNIQFMLCVYKINKLKSHVLQFNRIFELFIILLHMSNNIFLFNRNDTWFHFEQQYGKVKIEQYGQRGKTQEILELCHTT